jgi:hypothetical protein
MDNMHELNYSSRTNIVLALVGLHPMTVSIPQEDEAQVLGMVMDWIPMTGTILAVEPVEMLLSYN